MSVASLAPFGRGERPSLAGRTILQIIPHIDAGGAERTTIDIAAALVRAGARALVASQGGRLAGELQAVGGIAIPFPAASKNPLAMLFNTRRLARLIIDERASDQQAQAIGAIASGAAGGPMAALGPLVGHMAGIERRPISFSADGMKFAVKAGDLIVQACEGVAGIARPNEPLYIDNTMHPVNTRLALAKATRSIFNAFGIKWNDTSGKRNGHFAPFAWSG